MVGFPPPPTHRYWLLGLGPPVAKWGDVVHLPVGFPLAIRSLNLSLLDLN